MLAAGPAGAMAGGIAAGAAMDGITTRIDSAVHEEYRPAGQVAAWTQAINSENPQDLIGGIVGIVATPVFDALGGRQGGKAVLKICEKQSTAKVYVVASEEAVEIMVEEQSLTTNPKVTARNPLAETCVTESVSKHSAPLLDQYKITKPDEVHACAKFNVDRAAWEQMKMEERSIPQFRSGAKNKARIAAGKKPFNLITEEKLHKHPRGKLNMNLKGYDGVADFNAIVKKVSRVNPHSFKYQNGGFVKNACRIAPPLQKGCAVAAAHPMQVTVESVQQA